MPRSLKREVLSRSYNRLIKVMFMNRFTDAQCGFKAGRREVALRLLPDIENTNWEGGLPGRRGLAY